MRDIIGKFLADWRRGKVLPYVQGRLLDIGCGLNTLARHYGNGTGVDIYQWGNVDVLVSNAASLPFPSGSFDTVTIIAALNHIPNRSEVLVEAARVLSPRGRLIITMIPPTISKFWHYLRRPWDADQKERGMAAGECYGITQQGIRRLLNEHRFSILLERRFMLGINCLTVAEKNSGRGR